MSDLNIHRDKAPLSEEDILKHQNFQDVLQKSGVKASVKTSGKNSPRYYIYELSVLVVVVVISVVFISKTNKTKESTYLQGAENQLTNHVEKSDFGDIPVVNNIFGASLSAQKSNEIEEIIGKVEAKSDSVISPAINYLEPKEASTLVFPPFDEKFGIPNQIKSLEELSIYENVLLQPIGNYQKGWISASWDNVEFKESETKGIYYLEMYKGDFSAICQVVPVFEDEGYLSALESYVANK